MTQTIPGINTDVDVADVNGLAEAMQSALLAMWQEIYERTAEPTTAGVPWNRFGHVMVSSAGPTGVGAMAIGETFVVS